MSRITGFDAANLIEAYNAVYAPQEEVELTEEQIQEDFENWVNSLVEEGHDLSEYTWEDMYEEYITEIGFNPAAKGSTTSGAVTTYGANDPRRTQSGPYQSRFARPMNAGTPQTFGGGRSRQVTTRPQIGSLPPSARQVAQYPQGVRTGVGGGNAGASVQPPARPAVRPAAQPVAATTIASTRPVATAPAAPAAPRPTPTAAVPNAPAAPRPSLAQQTAELRAMRKASQQRQIAQGGTPATPLVQSFDPFDIVMGYLIDEGYAETEETAAVIMTNMSEEWRQSILDEGFKRMNRSKIEKQAKRLGGDRGDILRNVANRMNTPAERRYSTSQARRNRAGGAGSEYRKAQELRARDDAKADFEKYGLR